MTKSLLSVWTCLVLSVPGNATGSQESDFPCRFRGKAKIKEYRSCLKEHEPRYLEKGKGYTNLGNRYEFGETVARNIRQAAMYYELACDYGNGDGCLYLARLYRRGRGVKKDRKKAAMLLKRSYLFE